MTENPGFLPANTAGKTCPQSSPPRSGPATTLLPTTTLPDRSGGSSPPGTASKSSDRRAMSTELGLVSMPYMLLRTISETCPASMS